jgi:hypothetical protein
LLTWSALALLLWNIFRARRDLYAVFCSARRIDRSDADGTAQRAAAHSSDIVGAGTAGLRNATVERPDEFEPGTAVTVPKENVDIVAKDLHDLADRLGSP